MEEHLLQSQIWEKYEKIEGKTTFRLTGDDFDCLVTKGETPFGSYLYLPYGPTLRTQAKKALKNALSALQTLAKDQNAYFIRIEPTYAFSAADIASSAKNAAKTAEKSAPKIVKTLKSHDLDPHYTWVLDLKTASEEDLLKNMESRKVRYWRNAEKKGITIRATKNPDEITILTDFLKNLGEKDKFIPQTEQHLKNQLKSGDFATLYIAEYEAPAAEPASATKAAPTPEKTAGENPAQKIPIAAALVYDYGGTRYYAHAATDFDHRKFQAGSIILIHLILDAKKNGAKIFDFWGITRSEDKNHPWYHFTQYKKSFGGREVEYSGTYDLILSPVKYRLYQLARKANRLIRKAKN